MLTKYHILNSVYAHTCTSCSDWQRAYFLVVPGLFQYIKAAYYISCTHESAARYLYLVNVKGHPKSLS